MNIRLDARNLLIVVLLGLVLVLATALVRVENERNAMTVGMCENKTDPHLP
jgi:hypothetical protein